MTPRPGTRSRGRVAVAVVFAALALNAWAQVALVPLGRTDDAPALVALQVVVGAAAAATAWGSWTGARWAPRAALGYALTAGGMLAALPWLIDLPRDARGGVWAGAAGVAALTLLAAWYLRRTTPAAAREGAAGPSPAAPHRR